VDDLGSVRPQYNFWPGEHGLDAWDMRRLIELSRDLPVRSVPLSELHEIDSNYWNLDDSVTIREIADHVRLVVECDTSYPIILSSSGRIMDGMHRVIKCLITGQTSVDAVQFDVDPEPDYRGVQPEDLPYD
jgi:hypothetical protein